MIHLCGLGVVYEAYFFWIDTDDEAQKLSFWFSRYAESCFETLPFTVLQIYVMVLQSDYNLTLCVSLFFSLLSSGVMVTSLTVLQDIYELSFTEKIFHVMVWSSDSLIRVVPLAFILAAYNHHVLRIMIFIGVFLFYFLFSWMLRNPSTVFGVLNCIGSTLILFVSSISKFQIGKDARTRKKVLRKSEMAARYIFSSVVVLHLKKRDRIDCWQLGAFMFILSFSWVCQTIFYYIEKAHTQNKIEKARKQPVKDGDVSDVSDNERAIEIVLPMYTW